MKLFFSLLILLFPAEGIIAQTPQKKDVFVNMMVSFRTKKHSGKWDGWNFSNKQVQNNPDTFDKKGRPNIASVYHPVIGPYDMTDPDLVEHHTQLFKMMGIDGVMFDLAFYRPPETEWQVRSMQLYIKAFQRYGLKAVVIYEDKAHWIWNPAVKDRTTAVNNAYRDMDNWLALFEPVQYKRNGKPVFGFFSYENSTTNKGISRLLPAELAQWKKKIPSYRKPILISSWFKPSYKGILDTQYDWPKPEGTPPKGSGWKAFTPFEKSKQMQNWREKENARRERTGETQFCIAGVWPGFDDRGSWGWGGGVRVIPRDKTQLYQYQWERALKGPCPIVQVITWNDWFEGTIVEPAEEFGYRYTELTRKYTAKARKKTLSSADLRVPEWIYKIRKNSKDKKILEIMKQASEKIAAGKFRDAELLVRPHAIEMKIL